VAQYLVKILSHTIARKILVITGIVVGVFILFNYIVMPLYVSHGAILIVPSVVGMPLEDARGVLFSRGFEPVQAETRPDAHAPVGTIVVQNPPADAKVKHGRRIYLTISGGEVQVVVPQLRGRSSREAKFALERSGLKLGGVKYAPSEMYPENTILEQTVAAGDKVSKGTAVNVVVSQGRSMEAMSVPDLVGKSLTEAEKILLQQGLSKGNIAYQSSYDLLPNTIVDQFPRAGESVARGQAIDLFVVEAGRPKEEIEGPKR
jgi:eukaryotic-like serine/threonine-protein kinase